MTTFNRRSAAVLAVRVGMLALLTVGVPAALVSVWAYLNTSGEGWFQAAVIVLVLDYIAFRAIVGKERVR